MVGRNPQSPLSLSSVASGKLDGLTEIGFEEIANCLRAYIMHDIDFQTYKHILKFLFGEWSHHPFYTDTHKTKQNKWNVEKHEMKLPYTKQREKTQEVGGPHRRVVLVDDIRMYW